MKFIKFSLLLLITGFVFSMTSCGKDDPIDPGTGGADTTFSMSCKINGTPWTSAKSLANVLITGIYPKIDSLPVATFSSDSLLLGAGALYNGYQSTMLMAFKPANKTSLVGSYSFATDITNMKTGEAIGIFDGSSSDLLTYAFGITSLEYASGSKIVISKFANNRISGTFNFKIVKKTDQSTFYDVSEGKFENFKIE